MTQDYPQESTVLDEQERVTLNRIWQRLKSRRDSRLHVARRAFSVLHMVDDIELNGRCEAEDMATPDHLVLVADALARHETMSPEDAGLILEAAGKLFDAGYTRQEIVLTLSLSQAEQVRTFMARQEETQ